MSGLPVWLLVVMFLVAGAAIWAAGIVLSDQTDVLATRLGLGSALGGVILLAIATNLPEIAIVAAAAVSDNIGVAVGNILGGIAIQTVVLVALDAFGVPGSRPLTYRAASLVLVLEGVLVVAMLAIVVGGTQMPATLIVARLTPAPVLILMVWVLGLVLLQRAERSLPWHDSGHPPDGQQQPRGYRTAMTEQQATAEGASTTRVAASFGFAAVVTLIAGIVLERSGEVIAGHIDLSGVVFGATVLAAATSLPELSTGLRSLHHGDYQLAVSDIFGGNAFLPVLFLPATLLSGHAVLPAAQRTDIYLTALGIVLTLIYVTGLLFRPRRRIARMGIDSLAVVILYGLGVIGLFTVSNM